jgi:hypothetical protein
MPFPSKYNSSKLDADQEEGDYYKTQAQKYQAMQMWFIKGFLLNQAFEQMCSDQQCGDGFKSETSCRTTTTTSYCYIKCCFAKWDKQIHSQQTNSYVEADRLQVRVLSYLFVLLYF